MPSLPTIKHANHRVYQVTHEQKSTLLASLLAAHEKHSVLLLSKQNDERFKELQHESLTICDDTQIATLKATDYDLVISFDLPDDATTYMQRIALAKEKAFLLLDASEQNSLYQIEVLLGRAIKQEAPQGFGYPAKEETKKESPKASPHAPKEKRAYDKKLHEKPRNSEDKARGEKKPFKKSDKPFKEGEKKPFKKSDKPFKEKGQQGKKPNTFLGKDANGKALFSGKSGERNHRYDGKPKDAPTSTQQQPKKTGKTIQIKELKKKEDSKES